MRSFGYKDLGATQNPNLRLTALGGDLTVQLLRNLEQLGDYFCNVLRNMGGKILGYNSFPCSIFLNLRVLIGFRAFRDPKVEDD